MTEDTRPLERDDLVTQRQHPERGVYKVVDCNKHGRNWLVIAFRITPKRPGARRDEALFHGLASELIPYGPGRKLLDETDKGDQ
jgi:hypothetical protein